MQQDAKQWEFLGYDVRQLGNSWRAAWRDFLWGDDSPLRPHCDDVVRLDNGGQTQFFQAGVAVSESDSALPAVLLSEDHTLLKQLSLPLAVAGDLEQVLALEVASSSPFPADDTLYGWRIARRDANQLHVDLVMASHSGAMAWLAQHYPEFDHDSCEVWAQTGEQEHVVINGFGESRRRQQYRQRLGRLATLMVFALVVAIALPGIYALTQSLRLSKVESVYADVRAQASDVSQWRTELADGNALIAAVDDLRADYPSPHLELTRLTSLLNDDVSLLQMTVRGRTTRVQGRGKNIAAVMQQLTDHPAYSEVKAPQAITKLGNTGLERFMLDLTIAGGSTPE